MAQKVRFVDSVSVSAFGNTGPTSVISASAERVGTKSVIKFTQANGNNFTVPIVASASAFDAVVSASVNLNQITFERGDETTFSVIVDTGSLSNEAFIESLTAVGISGSFNIASSSFSTRVSTNETNISSLQSNPVFSSLGISGSFTAPSSSFSTRVSANEIVISKTLLSSSAQIATEITGAFTTASSSFSTRVTANEKVTAKGLLSSSAQIATEITGAFFTPSSSFSTRVSTLEAADSGLISKTLISSSAQISEDISGSFTAASSSFSTRVTANEKVTAKALLSSSAQISTEITGAFFAPSSSFSTRVSTLEASDSGLISKTLVSSSAQIATEITGAFTAASSSFSTRVTANEKVTAKALLSSSAQIATEITGAFTNASSSFSTRVSTLEAADSGLMSKTLVSSSAQIANDISGSFIAASSSFSTRVTANEKVTAKGLLSSSAQIAENISGSFVAPSASFSTRVTNLKTDSGSFSTRVTTLEAGTSFTAAGISGAFAEPSSSFSTRVSSLEGGSGLKSGILSSSAQIADDISGSFTAPSSSISTRLTSLEAGGGSDFTPAGISGSWQSQGFISASQVESNLPTGTLSSSAQIADDISGSFNAASSSFSTRVTANEATVAKTLVSSSAQIATEITGAFTVASSSFSTRVTANEVITAKTLLSSSAQIASNITGAFGAASASFSTRVTNNETNITNLTAETGSYVQFPFDGDAVITGSLDVSGSSNSRLVVKYNTNYDAFINGRLFLGSNGGATPAIYFGSTNAATTLARGAGTSVTAFQWTFDNSLTGVNHPGSFLRIYGSGSSFERGLNITQSNATKGLGVSGSVEIVGPITASGNISASGDVITQKVGIIDGAGLGLGFEGGGNENSDVQIFTDSTGEINFVKNSVKALTIDSNNQVKIRNSYDLIVEDNISASGALFFSSSLSDDTNLKTLMYNTSTGKIFHTGSYGGGSGGGFTPSLSTDLPAQNITASGNISASGTINGLSGSFESLDVFVNLPVTTDSKFRVGRDSVQYIGIGVSDYDNIILAKQDDDSPGHGNQNFILNRDFDGAGTNNFKIQKDGTDQFIIDTSGNIEASANISASGALFFSSSLSDNTSLKTLVYDTSTGKIFHTGSYGGGSGGGFTPSLSTDLPAQNITASGNISASGHISASNLVLNKGSVASPAIGFGTTKTGIFYNSGANSVAFTDGSATIAEFSNYILFRKYLSMNSNYIQNILYLSGPRLELRSTNGTITASAGISASGDISALDLNLFGGGLSIKNQGAQSYARFYCESSNAHYTELKAQPHALYSGNPVTLLPAYDFDFAKPNFIPPITASIISASNKFIGSELSSLGDLTLDADGADIILKDGGTSFGRFKRDSSDFIIKSETNNNDIIFKGQDGGSTITALTLDMSEGGKALFTGGVEITGSVSVSGSSFTIENSGSTIFEVIGSEGTIFSLEDNLSGSLFSVGDISGLPQFEVFSDGKIVGDEGVATLRTQRPMVTHTIDFNITSSLDFAGKYHIVGGNLTCSIDTGSLIPVGSEFEFFQTSSTNNFLFETASHVDLIVKNDNLNLSGRGSGATLKYIAGSTFHLVGDLT